MAARILIIDSVATNRIVLRAKILAAHFAVDSCANCDEARAAMAEHLPDLVLINLCDASEDRHSFCKTLRMNPPTAHIPIISTGVADTARTRFAALDAGADDVLPRPVSDVLMMARIRSLLRRRNVAQELQLRDGTGRALGFEEESAPRLTPARITVLSDGSLSGPHLVALAQSGLSQSVRLMTRQMIHAMAGHLASPDIFVVDGAAPVMSDEALFQMVSDLLARQDTRLTPQLVVVPDHRADLAAMVLDLGAQDVVFESVSGDELTLRLSQLIAMKTQQDTLRDRVRSGLQAAVTDPLTGLFNRRYAETHLKRMAEQAHETGCDYALMVLDIDHFKQINDHHGHAAGDQVLVDLATRLRKDFRDIDLLARIGGEEFLIALPDTTPEAAQLAAERIRHRIQARPFRLGPDGPELQVTVSVGVAVDAAEAAEVMAPSQLFAQADAALYDAKSSGRNTIVVSSVAA